MGPWLESGAVFALERDSGPVLGGVGSPSFLPQLLLQSEPAILILPRLLRGDGGGGVPDSPWLLHLTRSCCDAPGSCEAGMPLECSADCATQLPSFMDSCDQFLQLGVNSGLLSTLQSARAGCPAPVPCSSTAEFTAQMAPLNDACCTGGSDCSGGSPSECSSGCADVLLPLLERCSSYLLLPDNTALHSLLVDAASRCGGGGGH